LAKQNKVQNQPPHLHLQESQYYLHQSGLCY